MDSLFTKLQKLEKFEIAEKVSCRDLRAPEGYTILSMKRTNSTYGPTIQVEVEMIGGDTAISFLPKRFLDALTDQDIETINSGGFKIRCTGMTGRSIDINIYKK